MHTYLLDMLECPVCHAALGWQIAETKGDWIESGEARCEACSSVYPVGDGIAAFLTPELQRNDLWEQAESGLVAHLRHRPAIRQQLLEAPLQGLNPTDRMIRALLLESEGAYAEADEAAQSTEEGMYTPEYRACFESQIAFIVDQLRGASGPVVDLASGRCRLVVELLRKLDISVVATDFSPSVLRRDREYLGLLGLDDRVSLLAFDARRTPFRDGAVAILTMNLGLPNVEQPGVLLQELRRIVSGRFLAISHFYPPDDGVNGATITELGLGDMLYREAALRAFRDAGWHAALRNRCSGRAEPTPQSRLLEGVRVDGLPVASTQLEWGVVEAV